MPIDTTQPDWEFALLADRLEDSLAACRRMRSTVVGARGGSPSGRRVEHASETIRILGDAVNRAGDLIGAFSTIISAQRVEDAVGAPGVPGDERLIGAFADDLTEAYTALYTWSAELSSYDGPPAYRSAFATASMLIDAPADQVERFVTDLAAGCRNVCEQIRRGGPVKMTLEASLRLDIDDRVLAALDDDLAVIAAEL